MKKGTKKVIEQEEASQKSTCLHLVPDEVYEQTVECAVIVWFNDFVDHPSSIERIGDKIGRLVVSKQMGNEIVSGRYNYDVVLSTLDTEQQLQLLDMLQRRGFTEAYEYCEDRITGKQLQN